MTLLRMISLLSLSSLSYIFLLLLLHPVLYYLIPFLHARPLISFPGPKIAAFSNFWLLYQCRRGQRFLAVDAAHKKYGPVVRIQPNHISIADPDAIGIIYGHSGGWLKRCVNVFTLLFPRDHALHHYHYMAMIDENMQQ